MKRFIVKYSVNNVILLKRFEFEPEVVDWIHSQTSFVFQWDEGNKTKSYQKHGITCQEAESVFAQLDAVVMLGKQVQGDRDEFRYGLFGKTSINQKVFMCFTIRHNQIRIISIRRMNKREEKFYDSLCQE